MRKIYLAGPDVFLEDASTRLLKKQQICAKYSFVGLSPLDNDVEAACGLNASPDHQAPSRLIYLGNLAQMQESVCVVANLSPFRSPSADVGTAFELGYMRASGKPIFGYSIDPNDYIERIGPIRRTQPGHAAYAPDGHLVEDFGHFDNLMVAESLRDGDDRLCLRPALPEGDDERIHLDLFEKCVLRAAEYFRCR